MEWGRAWVRGGLTWLLTQTAGIPGRKGRKRLAGPACPAQVSRPGAPGHSVRRWAGGRGGRPLAAWLILGGWPRVSASAPPSAPDTRGRLPLGLSRGHVFTTAPPTPPHPPLSATLPGRTTPPASPPPPDLSKLPLAVPRATQAASVVPPSLGPWWHHSTGQADGRSRVAGACSRLPEPSLLLLDPLQPLRLLLFGLLLGGPCPRSAHRAGASSDPRPQVPLPTGTRWGRSSIHTCPSDELLLGGHLPGEARDPSPLSPRPAHPPSLPPPLARASCFPSTTLATPGAFCFTAPPRPHSSGVLPRRPHVL